MNYLYKQLAICLALWLGASAAVAETPTCIDTTLSATGRQQLTVPGGAEIYGSVRFSYRTTGLPTAVSISIEAGNVAAATQTPFEQIAAVTNTSGASMGTAAAGWRFWFVNVATLAGGTSPTIILTSCFHPSAFSIARFGTVPTFPNQSANTLFAGPGSGAAATPAFRALVLADLPATTVTGAGTAGQSAVWNGANTIAASPAVRFADKFAGADFDDKVTAAHTDLPATGGTIDARGLEGAQTANTTITLSKPVRLLWPAGAVTYSGTGRFISATVRGIVIEAISHSGDGADASGSTMAVTGTGVDGILATDAEGIVLKNFNLTGPGSGTGIGINMESDLCQIENVAVKSFGGSGVVIDGTVNNANLSRIVGGRSGNNGSHGYETKGTNGNLTHFISAISQSNAGDGFHIATPYNLFSATNTDSNGAVGTGIGYQFVSGATNNKGVAYSDAPNGNEVTGFDFDAGANYNTLLNPNFAAPVVDAGTSNIYQSTTAGMLNTAHLGTITAGGPNDNLAYILPSTRFQGFNQPTGAGAAFGAYGGILFNANNSFDARARRYLITNALDLFKFAIVRSSNSSTDPSLGNTGVLASGTVDFTMDETGNVGIGDTSPAALLTVGNGDLFQVSSTGVVLIGTVAFAALGTPANGTEVYCSNCDAPTVAGSYNTCASTPGPGAWAKRIRGAWSCF